MAQPGKDRKLSKDAILDLAQELFSRKGYRNTSLRDLTTTFDVSRPAIYYYFKNKMEILAELHSKGFMENQEQIDGITASDLSTRGKLRKILEIHARTIANHTKRHKVFFLEERELPDDLRKVIKARRKDYLNKSIKLYEQGVREGVFKSLDPKLAVNLLFGACNWLIMWYSDKEGADQESVVQTLMTIVCEGYEAEE